MPPLDPNKPPDPPIPYAELEAKFAEQEQQAERERHRLRNADAPPVAVDPDEPLRPEDMHPEVCKEGLEPVPPESPPTLPEPEEPLTTEGHEPVPDPEGPLQGGDTAIPADLFDPPPPEAGPKPVPARRSKPALAIVDGGRAADRPARVPASSPRILVLERAPQFHARVRTKPPLGWYAQQLVPSEGRVLFHGRPRALKSLSTLSIALHLSVGRDLWNDARFHVPAPIRVLYVAGEDADRVVDDRLERLRRGIGPDQVLPEELSLLVRPGLSLDNEGDRALLDAAVKREGIQVLVLEPMRSLTSAAEGTSADFKEIADWLQRLQEATSCKSLILAAHWRKPPQYQHQREDPALLADKVAGAALFSFSDCLVGCEKLDFSSVAMIPSHFKISSDPKPFVVTYNSAAVQRGSGEPLWGPSLHPTVDTAETVESALGSKDQAGVLAWIEKNPWEPVKTIVTALGKRHGSVLAALHTLEGSGRVVSVTGAAAKALGAKNPRARLYALAGTPVPKEIP